MTEGKYCSYRWEWERIPEPQARIEFQAHLTSLPQGRVSCDRKRILASEEVSVNALYQRQQSEILSLSHRNVRNPNPQQFAERAAWLGQDHQSWQDPGVTRAMGYQDGALESGEDRPSASQGLCVRSQQVLRHAALCSATGPVRRRG